MRKSVDNCTCIGIGAGASLLNASHCVMIGNEAGRDIACGIGIVIIGDNVHSLDPGQEGVLFIGDRVAIGKTLFGQKLTEDWEKTLAFILGDIEVRCKIENSKD